MTNKYCIRCRSLPIKRMFEKCDVKFAYIISKEFIVISSYYYFSLGTFRNNVIELNL